MLVEFYSSIVPFWCHVTLPEFNEIQTRAKWRQIKALSSATQAQNSARQSQKNAKKSARLSQNSVRLPRNSARLSQNSARLPQNSARLLHQHYTQVLDWCEKVGCKCCHRSSNSYNDPSAILQWNSTNTTRQPSLVQQICNRLTTLSRQKFNN